MATCKLTVVTEPLSVFRSTVIDAIISREESSDIFTLPKGPLRGACEYLGNRIKEIASLLPRE